MTRFLLSVLLAATATVVMATPAEAAVTFTASRTNVINGESVRFAGSFGTHSARTVVLQRKSGTSWFKVASKTSTSTGAFSFTIKPTGTVGTSRAYRAHISTANTSSRTITFVAQTATLAAPATVTTGKQFTATGTFRPIRTGRVTILQRRTGTTWTEVARGKENSLGKTAFKPTLVPTGAVTLRAVAAYSAGAPAKASASRAVTVLPPAVQRVSEDAAGTGADVPSYSPAISADGRYVAFYSASSSLVPGDTNGQGDIFVRDLQAHTIERVSLADDDSQSPAESVSPSISGDGRYVTFDTPAILTPNSPSSYSNVYVRDRVAGTTTRVSVPAPGVAGATNNSARSSISADGR
jgi:hypothetical protein